MAGIRQHRLQQCDCRTHLHAGLLSDVVLVGVQRAAAPASLEAQPLAHPRDAALRALHAVQERRPALQLDAVLHFPKGNRRPTALIAAIAVPHGARLKVSSALPFVSALLMPSSIYGHASGNILPRRT